ncbi:MAG: hypothetical protein EA402_03855 [Planctomycetota bacterium]|nr:MAG: hypothetical protein EA402_03855 [Planctomycetota bacterium]
MIQRWAWIVVLCAAGALLAGNLVLGTVVAPTLFRTLTTDHAGLGFGNILRLWTEVFAWPLVIIAASALAVIFAIRLLKGHSNWFTAAGILALALVGTHWWSTNLVRDSIAAREYMRNVQPLRYTPTIAEGDSRAAIAKKHFDYLHRASNRAFLAQSFTALLTVLLASGALIFTRVESSGSQDDLDDLVP